MNEQTEHPENQPAFPMHQNDVWGGMSIRHWYAGLAMQSLIPMRYKTTPGAFTYEQLMAEAVVCADLLIAELEKEI